MFITLSTRLNAKLPDLGLDGGYNDFFFYVEDVRESTSALDALGPSVGERECAVADLLRHQQCGTAPLDAIVDELVNEFGIKGLTTYPLLLDLLEFTVMQAVSVG